MASSSTTTHDLVKYDVFLSFRDKDTGDNFTSHLYAALCGKQIETFMDNQLVRGNGISPSFVNAIEGSRISVIILSKDYASSRWCLEELVKILECKNMRGQIVIPVFYQVDPSDVRNQTGIIADSFAKHEQLFKERLDKLQTWRAALKEVTDLSGWNSRDIKPEALLVETIVDDILKRLNAMSPGDDSDLIGYNSVLREIKLLLCNGSKQFCMVGIWGIGGIGKTTLATALFNKMFDQFEGCYFIENVREKSENRGLVVHWQQQLLSDILGDKSHNTATSVIGCSAFTKRRLGHKKVLIVFDDVSDSRQIEFFVKDPYLFRSGSRIIITTRDKHVLTICGSDQMYELEGLFHDEALQLFNRLAFGRNHPGPAEDYEELSDKLVRYANGVPLALKVLGSYLLGKEKQDWESAGSKLGRIPHEDIQSVLKISYDGLQELEQDIFLDIACFFKGEDEELVKNILDANGLFPGIGMSVLKDKALITTTLHNKITMHDLLQEMGREIVRQESTKYPGKRSILWHHEDIYQVLTKNMGTEAIEGISLDLSKSRDIHLHPHAFAKMHHLKLFKFHNSVYEETHNKVHDFQLHNSVYEENHNKVHDFLGIESEFTQLRYLHWHGYPFKYLLSNFHVENIVALHIPHSNVEQLWNGVQNFVNLKHMNLIHSNFLTRSPSPAVAPNLESLILEGCTNLLELSYVENLSKLVVLNLRECKSLASLPTTTHMKCLRTLVLSGCSNLNTISDISCNVEMLFLDGTAIEELPSSIEYLSRLVMLNLKNCSRLESLPGNICKLKSLEYLYLSGCSKLQSLPNDLRGLEALKELRAERTAIREVPSSLFYLSNLGGLYFDGSQGQGLLGLLLPQLSPDLPGKFHNLKFLTLDDCGITELPDSLGQLYSLRVLSLGNNNFQRIPTSIIGLSNLFNLNIRYCKRLQSLPAFPCNTSVNVHGCTELQAVSGLPTPFTTIPWFIQSFNFMNCLELEPNALNRLVEYVKLKVHHMANVWLKKVGKGGLNKICSLSYPGSEIPEWFEFQSEGSFITLEVQPGWFNNNFVGFAGCAVVAFRGHGDYGLLGFRGIFECQDKHRHAVQGHLSLYVGGQDCDHVFLGCDFNVYPNDSESHCSNYIDVYFEFYLSRADFIEPVEFCKVTKCGVHLMYGQPSGSFSSETEEMYGQPSGSFSSEIEDSSSSETEDRQPKKLKSS